MASTPERTRSCWGRLQYHEDRETASETRNVLLIVVALIITVTFQAGVTPPGGVWQKGKKAGRAIYADQEVAFYVFLISNTLALSTSILVLMSITYRFPFHFELWIATTAMLTTYASAVYAVAPNETVRFRYVMVTASVPFVIRLIIQVYYKLKCK